MNTQGIKDTEKKIIEKEVAIVQKIGEKREKAFEKYPLVFTLLGTFGLVATFYGFERVIDRIDVFKDNPYILLGTGIITLVVTGSLYKKLQ
jgi:hypothetical protein